MTSLLQDLRFGVRTARKTPGFTAVAIAVLALGIGANSAMFTLVNALLFKPLAGRADELVGVFSRDRTKPGSYRAFSYPEYLDIRDRSGIFAGLMAHNFAMVGVPEGDGTMLDHTVFLYGTGISDSNTHFHDDLPIAIVGGKAAGIKGGRYIRYPKGTPLTNMHLTILENMGVHPESIGDSTGKLGRLTDV